MSHRLHGDPFKKTPMSLLVVRNAALFVAMMIWSGSVHRLKMDSVVNRRQHAILAMRVMRSKWVEQHCQMSNCDFDFKCRHVLAMQLLMLDVLSMQRVQRMYCLPRGHTFWLESTFYWYLCQVYSVLHLKKLMQRSRRKKRDEATECNWTGCSTSFKIYMKTCRLFNLASGIQWKIYTSLLHVH